MNNDEKKFFQEEQMKCSIGEFVVGISILSVIAIIVIIWFIELYKNPFEDHFLLDYFIIPILLIFGYFDLKFLFECELSI